MSELTPAHAELTITPSAEGEVPVLAVTGELDMSNADTVKAAVAASNAERAGRLIFELSGLRFIDSAGIAALLEAAERIDNVVARVKKLGDLWKPVLGKKRFDLFSVLQPPEKKTRKKKT